MGLLLKDISYFHPEKLKFEKSSILIDDGKIIKIGEELSGDQHIDGTGKYLIPGLIDAHIHFFQSAGLFTRPDGLDLRHIKSYEQEVEDIKQSISELFNRYLANGITGIVDCGGPFWNFEVRTQAESSATAPHVGVAGPLVSTVSREKLDLGDPPIIKAESEEHARELVRDCIKHDPVFVKFWFIYQEDRFDQDSQIIQAGIEECKEKGYRAAIHATELETARRAVIYGADILVHSVFNEVVDDEFIELLSNNETIYIPTLMVRNGYRDVYRARLFLTDLEQRWGDPAVIRSFEQLIALDAEDIPESHRALRDEYDKRPEMINETALTNLTLLYGAGIIIATGTDAGNVGTLHGPSLHTEMQLMASADIPPADILVATTVNGAKVLGRDDIGEIKEGMTADLVLLDQNPLDDISNTQFVSSIIKEGVILRPQELITPFDPVSVVQGQVEAYNSRDLERFLSYYHPHVKILDFKSGDILMEGIDQMRERYNQLFENSPDLQAEVVNRISLGDMVIDHEEVTGHYGRDKISAIAYNEVRHQKITRVWFSK